MTEKHLIFKSKVKNLLNSRTELYMKMKIHEQEEACMLKTHCKLH